MRARKWRYWLVAGIGGLGTWFILFAAWIGVAILRGSTERQAGALALNFVLIAFIAIVGLLVMHRATYRSFWHADRRRALDADDPTVSFGSNRTLPPPVVDWPLALRLRHILVYVVGIVTLLFTFAPYANQLAIVRFLTLHSAGRTSAGSLSTLLFGYLPMLSIAALAMLATYRQMRRRDAGLLDARQRFLLDAETNWLFSFGAAFGTTVLLCRMAGGMIVAHL
jgi:hypothetical protein